MSILKKAVATCSKCGKEHEISVYKSINTEQDPSLKEKVLDGSAFMWECPSCATRNLAKYECLYHDPEKRFMVWLMPIPKDSQAEAEAIARHAKALGDYVLRECVEVGELIEKILILDAGFNDVAVEISKYVLRNELAERANSEQERAEIISSPIHFHRIEEDNTLSFTCVQNGQMGGYKIGRHVYDDALGVVDRNPDLQVAPGFRRVDAIWLSTVLR